MRDRYTAVRARPQLGWGGRENTPSVTISPRNSRLMALQVPVMGGTVYFLHVEATREVLAARPNKRDPGFPAKAPHSDAKTTRFSGRHDPLHRRRPPIASARRCQAPPIQAVSDRLQRYGASLLQLDNDRLHVRRPSLCRGAPLRIELNIEPATVRS